MTKQRKKNAVSRPVTLWSDGSRLAGDLWSPADLAPEARVPAMLLLHGFGGLKKDLNDAYARHFAALGYIVLTFDYRGFGESDGNLVRLGERTNQAADGAYDAQVREVRDVVDVLDEVEDARSALAFLMGEPQVDATKLAVWGSSLGAAMALETACQFPKVKVLIIQVGSLNVQGQVRQFGDGDRLVQFATSLARGDKSPFLKSKMKDVPAFQWDRLRRFDPMRDLNSLEAATLVIDAEDEELWDASESGGALFERISDRLPSRYETIAGTHHDIYSGDAYCAALALQKEWLAKHLPSPGA